MTSQTSAPLRHQGLSEVLARACDLAVQVRQGRLDLDPPYQRGAVWTRAQQVGLVKSWLLGLPIPVLILNDRTFWSRTTPQLTGSDLNFAVIDGKQRLLAAVAWFTGQLAVPASWFPADEVDRTEDTDDGPYTRFTWLTTEARGRIELRALLPTLHARATSLRQEAETYLLVNGAGVDQTPQDLARAAEVAHGAGEHIADA